MKKSIWGPSAFQDLLADFFFFQKTVYFPQSLTNYLFLREISRGSFALIFRWAFVEINQSKWRNIGCNV